VPVATKDGPRLVATSLTLKGLRIDKHGPLAMSLVGTTLGQSLIGTGLGPKLVTSKHDPRLVAHKHGPRLVVCKHDLMADP